jgi:hypothetical protein
VNHEEKKKVGEWMSGTTLPGKKDGASLPARPFLISSNSAFPRTIKQLKKFELPAKAI